MVKTSTRPKESIIDRLLISWGHGEVGHKDPGKGTRYDQPQAVSSFSAWCQSDFALLSTTATTTTTTIMTTPARQPQEQQNTITTTESDDGSNEDVDNDNETGPLEDGVSG